MNGVLSPTVCFQEMGKILRWAAGGVGIFSTLPWGWGKQQRTLQKYKVLSYVSIPEKQAEKNH